jgi:preprotein translocase subunit SecF
MRGDRKRARDARNARDGGTNGSSDGDGPVDDFDDELEGIEDLDGLDGRAALNAMDGDEFDDVEPDDEDADDDFDDEDELDDDDLEEDGELPSVDAAARSLLGRGRAPREPRPGRPPRPPRLNAAGEPRGHGPLQRLYRGETRFDFVGRKKVWFSLSTVIIVAGIISIILRGGLNLGIEFKGGTEWTVKAPHVTQVQATNAMQAAGLTAPIVQLLGQGSNQQLNVQADLNKLSPAAQKAESLKVENAIAKLVGTSLENVENGVQTVGPTWGSSITNKAIEALIVFFIVVGIYISIRFEPKMALAAFIAMVHDVLVAVGVYSLFNFQVTPDTVVAILTILGYSLYDTVVVFDRVRDNTKNIGSSGRMSYSQLINLSMNQTLARSINTSAVAIIPVLAVLLVGAELLGASTLQEYGLALFVGLLSGAYSSIFIASPILAILKGREPRWIAIENRLITRGERGGSFSATDAAHLSTQLSIAAGGQPHSAGPAKRATPAKRTGPIRPGSGAGNSRGPAAGTGTAVLDRPSASGGGARQPPRPRKGKGKRQR